jgi:hypothetical protein
LAFLEGLREGGYRSVLGVDLGSIWNRPIEVIRYEWPSSRFIVLSQLAPEANVAGLYWRDP